MSFMQGQITSLIMHGLSILFVLFFVPKPAPLDSGDGLLVELIEGQKALGQQKRKPKVLKDDQIILSKPRIVTKTQKPKKMPVPKKPPLEIPQKLKKSENKIVQKEDSFFRSKLAKQNAVAKPKVVKQKVPPLPQSFRKPQVKAIDTVVAAPTKKKPSAFPAAPIVGKDKASLAEALGSMDGVRDASSIEQLPGNTPPDYPTADRLQRRQGTVVILGYISEEGFVENAEVESSTGTFRMNEAAKRAFSQYRFSKGQAGWVRQPYNFGLRGQNQEIEGWQDSAYLEADAKTL